MMVFCVYALSCLQLLLLAVLVRSDAIRVNAVNDIDIDTDVDTGTDINTDTWPYQAMAPRILIYC